MTKLPKKAKIMNNFQEATIEEIYNILKSIEDGQSWKKAMKAIHIITDKENLL